ncbi:MAG TPA: DUF559 domain-containing protein [Acidimicrobiia bacterium]|nr:DUF559 domain-containing protein [Acidimicrobiia bacterium]
MVAANQLNEYFARQYGVISRRQAMGEGLTESQIAYRLATGNWTSPTAGVYMVATSAPDWHRELAAAVLSRPRAIVTGGAAARIYGYEGFGSARPEIMVPHDGNARSPVAKVVRSQWFDQVGVVRRDGFQVSTEPETMVVLARSLGPYRLGRLLDERASGGHLRLTDFDPIRTRLEGSRLRGGRRLLDLIDERTTAAWRPPASELERHLDRLVHHPGVPESSRQVPLNLAPLEAVVDRFIALWGMVLEADGRAYHTRLADFERDRARDNAAVAQGFVVLRFTWRMLTTDLAGCRRTLLAAGATRAPS